jgi:hypothetical protein
MTTREIPGMDDIRKFNLLFQNMDAFIALRKYRAVERCKFNSFSIASNLCLPIERVGAVLFSVMSFTENLSMLEQKIIEDRKVEQTSNVIAL